MITRRARGRWAGRRAARLIVAVIVAGAWVAGCEQSPAGPGKSAGGPGESEFSWTFAPPSLRITPGGKGTFTIRLGSKVNINSDVSLSLSSSPPPNTTWTLSPQRLASTARDAELTVQTTPQTPLGEYPLTITATEIGYGMHTSEVSLQVVSPDEPPGFQLSLKSDFITVTKDSAVPVAFSVIPFNGFTGRVDVFITGTEVPPAPVTVTRPIPDVFTFERGDPEKGGTFMVGLAARSSYPSTWELTVNTVSGGIRGGRVFHIKIDPR